MAKSNFIVRGGADMSGLTRGLNQAQKRMSAFQASMTKAMKGLGVVLGTLAVGKLVKDSTKAAMTVESSMAQLNRIMGANADNFENWALTQSKSFGMAREEAFKYGATYGNLIGTFAKGTQETTRYTTELLKASAVVASATGRTMEDTMERIRSGLLGNTEAIEDLGINVNVAMLESTEAFKKFAKGRSWQQLAFQEQQQIRLMAILEQANTKYGDSLAGTTATRQMMFLSTLKNIRLNLGQAFLPIYNVILPALTSLASKLETVTSNLASFTQALFGKSTKAQTKQTQSQANAVSDLGDATEEAGKQAKKSLVGFDEINQLGSNTVGAGIIDTPANGNSVDNLVTEDDGTGGAMDQVSAKAQEMADKFKSAFAKMKNAIVDNKNIIVPAIGAIKGALAGLTVSAFIVMGGKLAKVLKNLWIVLAGNPIGLVLVGIGALIGGFVAAYKNNDKFREKVNNLWSTIKEKLKPVIENLGEVLTWLKDNILKPVGDTLLWLWKSIFVPIGKVIMDILVSAFNVLSYIVKSLWQNILVPLGSFLGTVFVETIIAVKDILISWWNKALKPLATFIGGIFFANIQALISVFEYLWYNVLKPLSNFMIQIFKPMFDTVMTSIKTHIDSVKTVFVGLINFIAGVFTGDWERAWNGVRNIFKGVFDGLYNIVKTPLNLIIDAINTVIRGLNKIKIDIPNWVPGMGGKSFGINIRTIPKLANGGITDANNPFMAIVGDNRTQREVISPLDDLMGMITQAVGNTSGGDLHVTVKVGEDTITQKVVRNINRQSRISGKTIITV